ncbi:hypothetical protein D3C80_896020 [compost metagenome]
MADDRGGVGDFATHLGDGVDGALHDFFALLGGLVGIVGGPRRFGGMAGHFLCGGGHFVHRRGHLIGAVELLVGAAGHHGGDRVQLTAGAVQVRRAALQTAEGFGEEIAQGVGGHRQFAQLVLTGAGHALGNTPLAELRHVFDQFADRLDQVAVDQPQAQQADQYPRNQHHDQPQQHRALGTGADQCRLLGALLAQLADQFTHLIAGCAVHTLDRRVARRRVTTGGHERVPALLIGRAQLAMFVTQALDAALELRLYALLRGQFAKDVLHIALTPLELPPVLAQVRRLLAAQQDVFPFLHLHLELQVGFIDQLRGVQRAFDQIGVVLHAAGQEVKARQGDQQHRQQAAAQQGENLCSQGLLQKHRRVLMTGMGHAR